MFKERCVPASIAILLRDAGFNEPCPGAHEYREEEGNVINKFHKQYSTHLPYYQNALLPEWLYAAPLYDQVFEFLFAKGMHIHDVYIARQLTANKAGMWRIAVFDTETGDQLWPDLLLRAAGGGIYCFASVPDYTIRKEAWNEAIIHALNFTQNHEQKEGENGTT